MLVKETERRENVIEPPEQRVNTFKRHRNAETIQKGTHCTINMVAVVDVAK